ncbi:MAG: hypothetical protein IPJ30_25565 [Acidobacteria bacterium]|nr:hypothetical protein [Acidobacteriota bacterium]
MDGVTFDQIGEQGVEDWLSGLQEELKGKSYRPQAVRRVMIPKPDGGSVHWDCRRSETVVQTAAKLVLSRSLRRTWKTKPTAIGRGGAPSMRPRRFTGR